MRARSLSLTRVTAKLRDAESSPEAWPDALESLTNALGIAGAACILFAKQSKSVDWVCFSGLSAAFENRYVQQYASLDPFSPLLNILPGWAMLSECFPRAALAKDEWYNDFVLTCGVRDIAGTRLIETSSHWAIFGLHQQIGRNFRDDTGPILDRVTPLLRALALRQIERVSGETYDAAGETNAREGTRYFFHIGNGRTYRDEIGKEFVTQEQALAHASTVAAELRLEDGWNEFAVTVTDGGGNIIARMPITD